MISSDEPIGAFSQMTGEEWSEPLNLSYSDGASTFPSITADPGGVVHLVWNEELETGEKVILYSRYENAVWSSPIDIIGAVNGATTIASDDQGFLHLAYIGAGGIYYSKAYAPLANSARAWSTPLLLYPGYNFLGFFDLAVGVGDSTATVCMSNAQQIGENSGIYVTCSFDRGDTWNNPVFAYENKSPDRLVDKPRLAIGQDGTIHVVWMETNYPETFPPLGIRYTNSSDGGNIWTEARFLAVGPYDDPEIAIRNKQEIHLVWSGTGEDRYKFHSWSKDDGRHWSEPYRNTDLGGLQGYAALLTDSNEILHWLTVGTILNKSILPPNAVMPDSLYYASFQNGIWSPGKVLFSGSVLENNMTNVSATVALGNQLHVVVTNPVYTPNGGYQMDIFYLYRPLDVPAVAARSLTKPDSIQQTPIASTTPEPVVTSTAQFANPEALFSNPDVPVSQSAWTPIAIGVIPILLLLAVLIMKHVRRIND